MAQYNRKWRDPKIFNGKLEASDILFLDWLAHELAVSRAVSLHRCLELCQHMQKQNPSRFVEQLGLASRPQP